MGLRNGERRMSFRACESFPCSFHGAEILSFQLTQSPLPPPKEDHGGLEVFWLGEVSIEETVGAVPDVSPFPLDIPPTWLDWGGHRRTSSRPFLPHSVHVSRGVRMPSLTPLPLTLLHNSKLMGFPKTQYFLLYQPKGAPAGVVLWRSQGSLPLNMLKVSLGIKGEINAFSSLELLFFSCHSLSHFQALSPLLELGRRKRIWVLLIPTYITYYRNGLASGISQLQSYPCPRSSREFEGLGNGFVFFGVDSLFRIRERHYVYFLSFFFKAFLLFFGTESMCRQKCTLEKVLFRYHPNRMRQPKKKQEGFKE